MSRLRIALFLCFSVLFSGLSTGLAFAHDRDDHKFQDRDHDRDNHRHHKKHKKHKRNDHDRDDRDRDHDRH